MPRLLGIGDNTVDVYVDRGVQYPGGNAVNVAVQARRLGLATSYLGCIGRDDRGSLIERSLAAEEVDVSRLRRLDGPTAFSRIAHQHGDRRFIGSDPGVRGRYSLVAEDDSFIASYDLVHTSVHSDIEADLPRVRRAARFLSYDYSEHLGRPGKAETLKLVDVAFLSCPGGGVEECRALLDRCAAEGPSVIVVTRGDAGACALAAGNYHSCDVVPGPVVDTLGAGDAFIAGFLAAMAAGRDVPSCLDTARRHAALACCVPGAFGYGEPATPFPADAAGPMR